MGAIAARDWTTEFPPFFAIPCFDTLIGRNGQLLLPLERHIPGHVVAAFGEGLLRLQAPAGLGIRWLWPTPPAQIARPTPPPAPSIVRGQVTPVMLAVEAVVRRHAATGIDMPSNPVLGELAGGRGRNTVSRALQRLAAMGWLSIEIKDGKRRVIMTRTGQATGWGPFSVTPHAPYSVKRRGEAPAQPPPVRPDVVVKEGEPVRYRIEPQKLAVALPSATCCWPMWDDADLPTHKYCDALVPIETRRAGLSYCNSHLGGAYVPSRGRDRNQKPTALAATTPLSQSIAKRPSHH